MSLELAGSARSALPGGGETRSTAFPLPGGVLVASVASSPAKEDELLVAFPSLGSAAASRAELLALLLYRPALRAAFSAFLASFPRFFASFRTSFSSLLRLSSSLARLRRIASIIIISSKSSIRVLLELFRGGARFPAPSSAESVSGGGPRLSVKNASACNAGDALRLGVPGESCPALRRMTPLLPSVKPRDSFPAPFEFIKYAAVCRAVAAADLRAACARAFANF